MHTFFINTSERVSSAPYREILFEELLAKKELLIPRDHVPLDGLRDHAEEIARVINQEADITEDTALLVYIESRALPESPLDEVRPRIVADETLQSLKAEAALVWRLCEMGKRPQELVFVFGEPRKRDERLEYDGAFMQSVWKRMWESIQLAPTEDVCRRINEAKGELTEQALLQAVTACDPKKPAIISKTDTDCYGPITENLAKLLAYHARMTRQKTTDADLYASLGNAVEEYTQTLLRDQLMGKYAVGVRYMYLPLEMRDVHEGHRSVCRLMMYVYAVAYNWNHPGFFDLSAEERLMALQRVENGVLHACPAPEVDYHTLYGALQLRMERCRYSRYSPADPPDELNKRVERKETLIVSSHKPPALIPENPFRSGGKGRRSSLIPDYLTKRGMRVGALREAVDRTLADILEKNENNQRAIIEYLNRATAEYDRIKDDALQNVAYTEPTPDFQGGLAENAEKCIDEMQNMEDKLNRLVTEREKEVLQAPPRLVTAQDVRKQVAAVERQADYYFGALKRGMTLLIAGIVFLLLVLAPYVTIMRGLFSVPRGYLFFAVTALIVIAALGVSAVLFSRVYKHKIIDLVLGLIDEFTVSQQKNQECLDQYSGFLYKLVPGYYALHRYEEALHDYKVRAQTRLEQITYHNESRSRQITRIAALLDSLDVQGIHYDPDADRQAIVIDPSGDRIANESVYILSAADVRDALNQAKEPRDDED